MTGNQTYNFNNKQSFIESESQNVEAGLVIATSPDRSQHLAFRSPDHQSIPQPLLSTKDFRPHAPAPHPVSERARSSSSAGGKLPMERIGPRVQSPLHPHQGAHHRPAYLLIYVHFNVHFIEMIPVLQTRL